MNKIETELNQTAFKTKDLKRVKEDDFFKHDFKTLTPFSQIQFKKKNIEISKYKNMIKNET